MKDPIAQPIPTTNAGISRTFSNEDRTRASNILEKKAQLESDVAAAQVLGEQWVETSLDLIKYLNPQGLGKERYFTYRNIQVCEEGKRAEIEKELSERGNTEQLLHGSSGTFEGTIMGPQPVRQKLV